MRRVFDATHEGGPSRSTERPAIALLDRCRAQSHLVGFGLLLGIVTMGSVGILVLGAGSLDEYETTVEIESAEQQLIDFAHAADTAVTATDDPRPVSIGGFDRGTVEGDETDGHVRVTHETESGTEELYSEPLGTIAYAVDDTTVAYQGGGVWRSDGNDSIQLSSPTIEYRDETLTVSILRLDDAHHSENAIDGTVRQAGSPATLEFATQDRALPRGVAGDVSIELESAYCEGWEREFERSLPGGITERCSAGESQQVRVEMPIVPTIAPVDSAIVASEIDIHENAPPIEGDVRAETIDEDRVTGTVLDSGYNYPSIDSQIADLIDDCAGEFSALDDHVTGSDRYCVDTIDDDHTIDTSGGDVTIVVRDSIGDPNYDDRIDVEGDNELSIVVDGDLDARGNALIGNESAPAQTRLLFSNDSDVSTANGNPTIAALLYAPDSTVSIQGSPTLTGAVVADRTEIGNINPGRVAYADGIDDVEVAPGSGPYLRYLDVLAADLAIDD